MGRERGPTWTPNPDDYCQAFQAQNPWHATAEVFDLLAVSAQAQRELRARLEPLA